VAALQHLLGTAAAQDFDQMARAEIEAARTLRAWRAETAKADGVPAYVIFHDATLAEIARNAPETIDDLRHIPGMGVRKLERFGDEIIDVVESA